MEDDVTCLYAAFPQKRMTGFTDVLIREDEAAGNITSMLKSLLAESENKTLRDHCQLHVFLSRAGRNSCIYKVQVLPLCKLVCLRIKYVISNVLFKKSYH